MNNYLLPLLGDITDQYESYYKPTTAPCSGGFVMFRRICHVQADLSCSGGFAIRLHRVSGFEIREHTRSLWRKHTEGLGISINEKIGMPFLAPDFAFLQAAGWLLILLAWPQARFRPSCSPIQSFCPLLPTPSTLLPTPSTLLPAAKVATLCRPCQVS